MSNNALIRLKVTELRYLAVKLFPAGYIKN